MSGEIEYIESCGNVFEDLGLKNPDILLLKAQLCFEISSLIKKKRWTNKEAAKFLGTGASRISSINTGGYQITFERLFKYLNDLGKVVEVSIVDVKDSKKPGVVRMKK